VNGSGFKHQERSNIMKHHTITGGGGVQLHLVETGDPSGRPILFIHGFSQCRLAWSRQLSSVLTDRYRLVAMDLRVPGYNLSVPPYVRQALSSRSFDNDDLLPMIRKPVLIVHGAQDAIVKPAVVDQHKTGLVHAQVHDAPRGARAILG